MIVLAACKLRAHIASARSCQRSVSCAFDHSIWLSRSTKRCSAQPALMHWLQRALSLRSRTGIFWLILTVGARRACCAQSRSSTPVCDGERSISWPLPWEWIPCHNCPAVRCGDGRTTSVTRRAIRFDIERVTVAITVTQRTPITKLEPAQRNRHTLF